MTTRCWDRSVPNAAQPNLRLVGEGSDHAHRPAPGNSEAIPAWFGGSGWWTFCAVRGGQQTTYQFHDKKPDLIQVTHPTHPLRGRSLRVVRSRRQGDELHWIAELPDGSRIQLPSSYTDCPGGGASLRGKRRTTATPHALRELLHLLKHLVAPSSEMEGQLSQEDADEQTTAPVRATAKRLGRPAVASNPSQEASRDRRGPRGDGEDHIDASTAKPRPAREGGGER